MVLERGRMVKHIEDYPSANLDPWDTENRGAMTPAEIRPQEKQMHAGFISKNEKHFFINDEKHPYEKDKRFDWIRGY